MATPIIPAPSAPQAGARVTVHRTSARDVKDRQLLVSLDGVRIATLLFGQTKSVQVEPGEHSLRVNNTLVWKTLTFEAASGDDLHFTAINKAPGLMLEMLTFVGVALLLVEIRQGQPREGGGASRLG